MKLRSLCVALAAAVLFVGCTAETTTTSTSAAKQRNAPSMGARQTGTHFR
jgi:PBP1b-binding outer membrane lipoprotein LpoB